MNNMTRPRSAAMAHHGSILIRLNNARKDITLMNRPDPRALLAAYLLFFAAGSRVLSEKAAIAVIAGALSLAAGLKLSERILHEEKKIAIRKDILYALFLISSIAVLAETLYVGGLAALDPGLLAKHRTGYLMLGLFAVPFAALILAGSKEAGWKTAALPAAAVLLTILIGYRTNVIAAIIAFSLIAYSKGYITKNRLYALLGAGLVVLLGLSWLKTLAGGSGASPLEALFYRAEGTASIFSRIADTTPVFGSAHGEILMSAFYSLTGIGGPHIGPRALMAQMFGAREGITFTTSILGGPYIDFGMAGVIALMLLLGLLLGWLSRAKEPAGIAAYSVLLAYALVEIETGILDMILFYYLAAAAYLLASLRTRTAKSR